MNKKSKHTFLMILLILLLTTFCVHTACADDESIFNEDALEVYDSFSFGKIVSDISLNAKQAFFTSLPIFFGLIGMLLIASVINTVGICFDKFDVGEYVSTLCFSGFLFSVVKSLCENLDVFVEKLKNISALVVPTVVASCMSDGAMTVLTANSGAAIAVAVIEFIVSSVVLPCARLLFVLMTVSSMVGKTLDLRGFSSSLRTFSVFCSAFLMTACVTVIHFQDAVARAADSVGNRAIRFAATNLVPIVGNLISESVTTVSHSTKAVGTISGAAGVAAMLSAVLPPFIACLIFKIEINICSLVAKTVGCNSQATMLSDAGGILNVLNAGIVISCVGFSLMICLVANII